MVRNLRGIFASMLMAGSCAIAAWNGTATTPKTTVIGDTTFYEISTPEELVAFIDSLESTFKFRYALLKNDIVFGDDTSSLSKISWERPRDNYSRNVVFKGNGKTIYGLKSSIPLFQSVGFQGGYIRDLSLANSEIGSDSTIGAGGLFTIINGATVENVEVRNSQITGRKFVGGIAGGHNYNDIYKGRLNNARSIKNKIVGNIQVGGIAGYGYAEITNAFNNSSITAKDDTTCQNINLTYVGGIVGNFTPSVSDTTHFLDSLINEGDINVESCASIDVGGIAGYSQRHIQNSRNSGKITAKSTEEFANVGGIVGSESKSWKYGTLVSTEPSKNLKNEGSISAEALNFVAAGGIFGYSSNVLLEDAFNSGTITGTSSSEASYNRIGGIAGAIDNRTEGAFFHRVGNTGNITSNSMNSNRVGGISGTYVTSIYDQTDLSEAFNYGNITVNNGSEDDYANVEFGGIVGYVSAATLQDVYNRGELKSQGMHAKWEYAGGLVGKLYYVNADLKYGYSATAKIEAKYAGGLIGSFRDAGQTSLLYQDSTLNKSEVLIDSLIYGATEKLTGLLKSNSTNMQSDNLVDHLNTRGGTTSNQKIWTRNGEYPIFAFDPYAKDTSTADTTGKKDEDITCMPQNKRIQAPEIFVEGLNLTISGKVNEVVEIFGLQGKLISKGRLYNGTATFKVPVAATYILRVGKSFRKISFSN